MLPQFLIALSSRLKQHNFNSSDDEDVGVGDKGLVKPVAEQQRAPSSLDIAKLTDKDVTRGHSRFGRGQIAC